MVVETRKPIGERLIDQGRISRDQLAVALNEQKRTGRIIGEILMDLGFITEEDLSGALAFEIGTETLDLRHTIIEAEALRLVPESFAREHLLLPLSISDNTIHVAMANAFDVFAIDEIQRMTGREVEVLSTPESDIIPAIDENYATATTIEDLIEESIKLAEREGGEIGEAALTRVSPIVKLIDQVFVKAIKERATDIHIEPEERVVRIRYRVDGLLHQGPSLPKKLQPAIISRVKIMANLNISEHRIPQDGRSTFHIGKKRVDLRVSTYPTVFGENIVLRILDKTQLILGLEHLGFSPETLAQFSKILEKAYGIILVTGPTGSGKTTTLYSALSYINSLEKHIITLEDPVEYELPIIRQGQINPKAGMDFAAGLRSILRQDPDIILVGEMRDTETIDMTIRAALTGHLVFSTLHTNDAVGAIPRLRDMGAKPFLIASTLLAVIAQRLVRVLCKECRKEARPDPDLLKEFGLDEKWKEAKVNAAKGCDKCKNTGYKGRIGIYEILQITPQINQLIMAEADSLAIRKAARQAGMKTMVEDGLKKVLKGTTTLEEVARVALV